MAAPEKQPLDRTALALAVGGLVCINIGVVLRFATPLGKPVIVALLIVGSATALGGLWRLRKW